MSPDNVPLATRIKASARTLERIHHFAYAAGWPELRQAMRDAGFVAEQEALERELQMARHIEPFFCSALRWPTGREASGTVDRRYGRSQVLDEGLQRPQDMALGARNSPPSLRPGAGYESG